ncbi:serine (or cysteine) peptidase inhibitor, clade H, member 2 [Solea solea]|uniref:serine (or cysteine) peptidase inhibitor, clade H, member 2 n=1 Tax=Solea solea TaxID=90069 RepID=UPI00272A82AA|nr:serine (or cysteine) peptidase inhibitor, clade H, member 2 [Solea solea]XP_058481482.1 serine (or cysteine) peptidase inhibitor, clade H, member 2 [Solea solea]
MVSRFPVCFLISLPVLLVQGSLSSAIPPPNPPPPPVDDPTWALGLRLYQALRSDSSSVNTLFSPLLVASSLGALGAGAAGTTGSQFQDLLKNPSPSKASAQTGELLSTALKSFIEANATTFHMHTSSAVFSKQAPPVSQAFVKDNKAKFRLQHQPLGKGGSKADLKQLHDWAKDSLGGLEAAPLEAELQVNTGALILANALCFKGLWEREFSDDSVDRRTFLGKKYTKVLMMYRAGLYRHYEDIENMVQVLEAPLWGGKASVVFLLPFHVENLARLDKLLTLDLLSKWLEKTNTTSVAISLPRANISSKLSLQKQLLALGLTDAWDQKVADFSGVSGGSKGKLHLSGVLHWASLELAPQAGKEEADLEEENIEKPKMFYADHPFIIFVRDNATGALLLMGALDHAEGEALHDEL